MEIDFGKKPHITWTWEEFFKLMETAHPDFPKGKTERDVEHLGRDIDNPQEKILLLLRPEPDTGINT